MAFWLCKRCTHAVSVQKTAPQCVSGPADCPNFKSQQNPNQPFWVVGVGLRSVRHHEQSSWRQNRVGHLRPTVGATTADLHLLLICPFLGSLPSIVFIISCTMNQVFQADSLNVTDLICFLFTARNLRTRIRRQRAFRRAATARWSTPAGSKRATPRPPCHESPPCFSPSPLLFSLCILACKALLLLLQLLLNRRQQR